MVNPVTWFGEMLDANRTIAPDGTLSLAGGVYDGVRFVLDPAVLPDAPATAWLDASAGAWVVFGPTTSIEISQHTSAALVNAAPAYGDAVGLGGAGTMVNFGTITSDFANAAAGELTISVARFVNGGAMDFAPMTGLQTLVVYEPIGKYGQNVAVPLTWTMSSAPTLDLASVRFDNFGTLSLEGGTLDVSGVHFHNHGTVLLTDAATEALRFDAGGIATIAEATLTTQVEFAAGVTDFVNRGVIVADRVQFDNSVSLASLGTIGGALVFAGTLDLGGGTLDASAYASVTITGTVENGTLVAGTGRLTLDGATLSHVTVADGGALAIVACFRAGTGIATPSGDVAVERLAIGDLVLTAAGESRAIKWLGRRAYDAGFVAANRQLRPVRIAAGALGDGLPRRALEVSPQHAMLVQGVLVPAGALVNGTSITRGDDDRDVAYVHIELADHDMILAEGAAAETFVAAAGRAMFHNAAEYDFLYPGEAAAEPAWHASRLECGVEVERIRRSLDAVDIAPPGALRGHVERVAFGIVEGWACNDDGPAVVLDLLIDDRPAGSVIANQYRADLDHHGLPACGFRAIMPHAGVVVLRRRDGATLPVAA